MARSSLKTAPKLAREQVRSYLAAQPPATRKALKQIRDAIRAAVPDGEDAFSYGIPAIKVGGKPVVWYAGWKEHVSLYPMGTAIKKRFARELAGLETSKGTIRFPLAGLPSPALVKRLVKVRLAEMRSQPAQG
jgi:uncharacterized protein YdhG (YjbR/CyaY superfamily)